MPASHPPQSPLLHRTLLAFYCLLVAAAAPASDISWLSAVNGFWDDGSKWSDGVPPGSGDSALITVAPGPGGYEVTIDADVDVARLELGASDVGPNLTVDGATLRIQGPTTSLLDSGRSLGVRNGAVIRFQAPTDVLSAITLGSGTGGGGSWFNEDVLTFDGGAAAVYNVDEVFDNSGTLAVSSGRLLISDSLTTSGPLTVASGAEIEFDVAGFTHTLAEGSTLGGAGTITVVGGAELDVTASTPPTFGAGLTVDLFGGLDGGSVVVDGTLNLEGNVMGTGELRNRGLLVANGDLRAKTLANEATLEIDSLDLFDSAVDASVAAAVAVRTSRGAIGQWLAGLLRFAPPRRLVAVAAALALATFAGVMLAPRLGDKEIDFGSFVGDQADAVRGTHEGAPELLEPSFSVVSGTRPEFRFVVTHDSDDPVASVGRLLIVDENEDAVGLAEVAIDQRGDAFAVAFPDSFPDLRPGSLYAWKIDVRRDGVWVPSDFAPFRVDLSAASEDPGGAP